ncbi:hypothetical protein Taro_046588 [Colocasia esculenta]|uniref:Uncharacterized protein n=1 Tax=Colocasia esculenta TaxID=4460 RepID=A0A843X4C1_COLES|nr:hypothetical protein [Colocasia esculenta]
MLLGQSSSVDTTGYNQLVDHVGIHGQRRLTEALNKDSLVRQKEYPMESSSKSRESMYIETSARRSRRILEQWSVSNGLNYIEIKSKRLNYDLNIMLGR